MTARRLTAPTLATRDWDSLQFKVIFGLSFLVYLGIAAVTRLAPAYWRGEEHRSMFADACAGAGTTAQIALWG